MTYVEYILSKFTSDFPNGLLPNKSTASVTEMCRGDRVKIRDGMLDYLQDFYNSLFNGQAIPKVFKKVLIEIDETQDKIIRRFYVTFPETAPGWALIDVFLNWSYIGKVFILNEDKPEDFRLPSTGRYVGISPSIFSDFGNRLLPDVRDTLVALAADVFSYIYLFIWANKENPSIFKEEEIQSPHDQKKGGRKKHHRSKANNTPNKREVVHVPTRRRIYTLTNETVSRIPVSRPSAPNYRVATWTVKGYTRRITKKDGQVVEVQVKPYTCHRQKPLAPGASGERPGKDYVLHERPLR